MTFNALRKKIFVTKFSLTKTAAGILLVGSVVGTSVMSCRSRGGANRLSSNSDTDQAVEVLNILGAQSPHLPAGSTGTCAGACHIGAQWHAGNLNAEHSVMIKEWAELTKTTNTCLTANAIAPAKKLSCFYNDPENAALGYNVKKIGFYRGAAHLESTKIIFMDPLLPSGVGGEQEYKKWFSDAAMPKQPAEMPSTSAFPQLKEEDFSKLLAWSLAGAPNLNEAFGPVQIVDPVAPDTCVSDTSDELKQQIERLRTEKKSWTEVNKQNPRIKMLGCAEGTSSPDRCFMDEVNDLKFPEVFTDSETKTWANRIRSENFNNIQIDDSMPPTQRMRLLKKLPFRSAFWARSSADGRFMGDGLSNQAQITNPDGSTGPYLPDNSHGFIVDLALDDRPYIGVSGPYDPGFFPDNNGFTWMVGGTGYFCNQRLLENPNTKFIDFSTETTFCGSRDVGVYQHVGRAIDDKYYIVRSDNYSNDDGGKSSYRADPSVKPFAKETSAAQLYTMNEDGQKFSVNPAVMLPTPFEGDFGISPSASFITSRIATRPVSPTDSSIQEGYRIRRFDPATAATVPLATVCMRGGKASISYNERFIVTHHYVDKMDAKEFKLDENSDAFKDRINNSSNVYIYDLVTKRKFRITFMNAGQYALYPHFRSDGWLYFLVRDVNKPTSDYLVASDVALRLPSLPASYTGIK